VPNPAEIVDRLVRFVGEVLSASTLRFDVVTTLVVLGVLLVFLQLVARPVSRWVTRDAGGLGGVGRAMALAAESGTDAVVSLGGGGLIRSTDSLARLQTLAALPILGHVARAAARSGVSLRVLTNDPLAAVLAAATVDASHEATATPERVGRSRTIYVGEGRAPGAGLALSAAARPAAAVAVGSLREEAQLYLEGLGGTAGTLHAGTAEWSQLTAPLLSGTGALIGPELYQAPADLRSEVEERTMVTSANRLIGVALVVIIVGSALALAGIVDVRAVLLGVAPE
jgi:hypothetical protein